MISAFFEVLVFSIWLSKCLDVRVLKNSCSVSFLEKSVESWTIKRHQSEKFPGTAIELGFSLLYGEALPIELNPDN